MVIWRAYELMESRLGNIQQSRSVYNRYIRESLNIGARSGLNDIDDGFINGLSTKTVPSTPDHVAEDVDGEVWMNNGNIEGKIPMARMKKSNKKNNNSSS